MLTAVLHFCGGNFDIRNCDRCDLAFAIIVIDVVSRHGSGERHGHFGPLIRGYQCEDSRSGAKHKRNRGGHDGA